jgi:hypothetical protein
LNLIENKNHLVVEASAKSLYFIEGPACFSSFLYFLMAGRDLCGKGQEMLTVIQHENK